MIVHLVASVMFWLNAFLPSKPGMGLYNTKRLRKLVLGTIVIYKKVLHLHPGEYVKVHKEDEPRNNIDKYQTGRKIVLGTQ